MAEETKKSNATLIEKVGAEIKREARNHTSKTPDLTFVLQ